MPTMSSCSLMSSTWSLIPITHQCNVSQKSLPHIALSGLFLWHSCSVQCNAMRCVKWLGERPVCGAGSISHFLPRMETRGRTHQQMGSALHCVKLQGPGATLQTTTLQGSTLQGPGAQLPFPFSPLQSIFSGTPQAFDDLIRAGNSLGWTAVLYQN